MDAVTGYSLVMPLHAIALVLSLVATTIPPVQTPKSSPEDVIRTLVRAIYANDVAAYNAVTVPDPRRARLTAGGRVNEAKLRQLETEPELLQIKSLRPFLYRGHAVKPDATGQVPVSTTAMYRVVNGGQPMIVSLVRTSEGWRVDVRWWLAMLELQSAEPKPGTPDYTARALTLALVSLDRKAAASFVVKGASMEQLFDGAPRQRDPSGVMEATAMEMPIVELRPGEFCELPDGRVVEGSAQPDLKVLLAQYGPIEVPFVLHRVGSEWRAEGFPYLPLLNR